MDTMNLLQSFGVDQEGRLVSVEEVVRGKACECCCPACGEILIAALQIATGKVFAHVGDTQTEADFSHCLGALIQAHPGDRTDHIVLDQLNTHQSETLVRAYPERERAQLGIRTDSSHPDP